MIHVGDKVRLLKDYGYEFDTDYIYANQGDIGIVLESDPVEGLYRVKFHEGWGGTMALYHGDGDDYPPLLEKVED